MKAAVVPAAGQAYRVQNLSMPEAGAGQVRIRVHACGFCHSDENIRNGRGGVAFPRVPGHEVAGVIEQVGPGVPERWRKGARVGVGWHGGHCLSCDACRAGDFLRCAHRLGCGTSYDGGFAEQVVVPWTALAAIPDALSFADAAPILCAGITVWNGLLRSGASWGDTVAVQGIGGLGHLAVQYAAAMGFRTVAISRGPDKQEVAAELGADATIDAAAEHPGKALAAMGGARAILTTVPDATAMAPLLRGLGPDGRMVIVGVSDAELAVPASHLLGNHRGVVGSVIGTPREVERLFDFTLLCGVRPWVETFALDDIETAVERLHANQLRFRGVFEMA